jgi:excisionase family DNA binding protein
LSLRQDERMLSPEELAERVNVPVATVYAWRYKGEGPRGYRVGRHVRFSLADVEAWLDSRRDREQS